MAKGSIVGIKVDIESVLVIQRVMLPSKLYVGDFQGIADGLDGIGTGALRRSKYCYNPQSELVTGWKRKGRCCQGSTRHLCRRGEHQGIRGGTESFSWPGPWSSGQTDKLLGTNSSRH